MKKALLLGLFCGFAVSFFCEEEEPDASDVAQTQAPSVRADSAAVPSPAQPQKAVRYDLRPDQIQWEYSYKAMNQAITYAISRLEKKYPPTQQQSSKGRVAYIHNKIAIELVQNVTPKELNEPDPVVNTKSFYMPQQTGLIAVFVIKVKVIRTLAARGGVYTQLGQLMNNIGMAQSVPDQMKAKEEEGEKILEKTYLVSIPNQPFMRSYQNPAYNPMFQNIVGAAGVETPKAPEISKIKMMFPSDKAIMKTVSQSELEAILSGKVPEKENSDSDEE